MIPNQDIDRLTEAMTTRRDIPLSQRDPSGREPFILFIGNECGRAAGVPSIENLAERALDLFGGDSEQTNKYLPKVDRSNKTEVLKALYQLLDRMPGELIYSTLQSLFMNIPVPLFYQDLALLVKAGFFNRIITTNIDTLLEEALEGAGMQAGFDYFVTRLGIKSSDREDSSASNALFERSFDEDDVRGPAHIIKLHGDIAQQQINLSPERIEKALRSQRRYVKEELEGDIVMVGYKFENEPINHWIASTRRTELWWVRPEHPEKEINDWAQQVSFITGEVGRPETFFSQLVLRLVRRPVLESLGKSFKDYAAGSGLEVDDDVTPVAAEEGFEETYGEKDPAVVELRDRIRRSQSVLFSLEQSVEPVLRPPSVQSQIDYQKKQIAEFENTLREHPECRKRIIELMDLIASYAERDGDRLGPRTLDFLQDQILAVLNEYKQAEPNQQIIGAALCTTVLLGDRLRVDGRLDAILGGVTLDSLRELATYVPSLAARGVV